MRILDSIGLFQDVQGTDLLFVLGFIWMGNFLLKKIALGGVRRTASAREPHAKMAARGA